MGEETDDPHGIQPRLRLVSLTPQRAVVALEIIAPEPLCGVGVVLKHDPGVEIELPAPEIRTSEGGSILQGVLARNNGRTSAGSYRLTGGDLPTTTAWELAFTISPEAAGGEIVLEELWVIDYQRQRTRLGEAARVRLVPHAYTLGLPYPNPFNPAVQIPYTLPEKARVEVKIYNILGQQTRTLVRGMQAAGFYQVVWDGKNEAGQEVGSGLYFVRVETGVFHETRRVVLIK